MAVMRDLNRTALHESLVSAIEEIDAIFEEFGFDPSEFDPDEFEYGDVPPTDPAHVYVHIHRVKEAISN